MGWELVLRKCLCKSRPAEVTPPPGQRSHNTSRDGLMQNNVLSHTEQSRKGQLAMQSPKKKLAGKWVYSPKGTRSSGDSHPYNHGLDMNDVVSQESFLVTWKHIISHQLFGCTQTRGHLTRLFEIVYIPQSQVPKSQSPKVPMSQCPYAPKSLVAS